VSLEFYFATEIFTEERQRVEGRRQEKENIIFTSFIGVKCEKNIAF
jgi:hypothetical protein